MMKKKVLIIAWCVMLTSLATSAHGGEEESYLSANFFGLGFLSDAKATNQNGAIPGYDIETSEGFAVGAAMGYDFYGFPRIEAEIAYQNNALDKVTTGAGRVLLHEDIDSLAILVNGYLDFTNSSLWTPFLSVGLGTALINVDDSTVYVGNDATAVFAYQIGAGIAYAVNPDLSLEGKYRYFATTDPEFGKVEMEYATHNLYVGMRYSF